jgi:hypothetical protein
MKDSDSAFPVTGVAYCEDSPGITLPQYAAIKLKVPRSGDPDIDKMIRESRRADFAEKVLGTFTGDIYIDGQVAAILVEQAFNVADAMLAKWEKKAEK